MDRGVQIHGAWVRRAKAALRQAAAVFALGAPILALASPALAALGGQYSSVEADRAHMANARMFTTTGPTHAMHALTMANGGAVREFTNSDGVVFAVTWRGPARPDLQQLLSVHFETMQADAAVRASRRMRAPLSVSRPDFVLRTGGHPGAVWGLAYLPQLLPAGFSADDLK